MLPKTRQLSIKEKKVALRACRTVAFLFLFVFSFCTFTLVSHAQSEVDATPNSDEFGVQQVGNTIAVPASPEGDLRVLIVRIINVILGFLGLVAVCLVLYAGYLWMTSQGNEEVVAQAKKMLINGVIGLIIILAAFTITSFILRSLLRAINGEGGSDSTNSPPVQTYSFSGSLGSIIKDHYPTRDQHDVPRNTSIVVTFGVPVLPSTIIENTNRTCWNAAFSGPTNICKTLSGTDVTPTTPIDQIKDPYFGDCFDVNSDDNLSLIDECDQLNTYNIIIDQEANFSEDNSLETHAGVPATALTTYDSDRNAFTFVFRPRDYLGSSTEDITYRVHLTTELKRSDTAKGLFDTQFSQGYTWNFTTGNVLDFTPPTVIDTYPEPTLGLGPTIPKNTILQVTFSEPIDPTTVESVITENNPVFIAALLNRTVNNAAQIVSGSWRLSNGYTVLEFTPSQECGVNSCGEKMFCLNVDCTEGGVCTNPYQILLRTAEWTRNTTAPFEAIPFSGIYDLAFNGLDNKVDNTTSQHLVKPDQNVSSLIAETEKAPDNYWLNFQVSDTIDRRAPYIEEVFPGVDAEDISGSSDVHLQFSNRMWQKTLEDIALEEYPPHICADAAIDTVSPKECTDNKRLDTLWYRTNSHLVGEKTNTQLIHREFGPNNLDLYYLPSVPSTVKNVTQNCVYPGRGPTSAIPAPVNTASTCTVTTDLEGNFVSGVGCADVSVDPATDTACVFTPLSVNNLAENISQCLLKIHAESPSSY